MDHDLYGAQKKVWKMLKNRKKPVNEFVQTKGVTKDVWESYFRKLYNTEEVINVENYETNHQITLNEEEVMAKIKKLKNRKAPGTDLIPNELLKYAGPELGKHLKILYNKILETSEIPTEQKYNYPYIQERTEDEPRQLQRHNTAEHKHETLYGYFEGET